MVAAAKRGKYTANEILSSFDDDEIALHRMMRNDGVSFAKIACDFIPHKKQEIVLQSKLEGWRKTMLPWGRQFGKTQIMAIYIAWMLFAQKGYTAYLFAPSGDQSKILFERICHIYKASEYLQRYTTCKIKSNTLEVGGPKWNSVAEYIKTGLTAENARGRACPNGIIVFDEIASFLYGDQVTAVIEPFIGAGGGIVYLSSPGEIGSFMHQLYLDLKEQEQLGSDQHKVIEAIWSDTNHLSKEFVEEQRRTLTKQGREWLFRREYLGEWTRTEGAFFNRDDVLACESQTPLSHGSKGDVWVYSLDPGLDRSPAVLLIARWNPVVRRLEIVECLSLVRQTNRYVNQDGGHAIIDGYPDLLDLILELRRERPIHRFYIDPGCEKNIGETLRNRFMVNVVDCRIGGYNAKLTALRDLQRSLATQSILWEDHRIGEQLLQFTPRLNPSTNRYEFPDSEYDIIAALTQLNRYLGDRIEEPFMVSKAGRAIW